MADDIEREQAEEWSIFEDDEEGETGGEVTGLLDWLGEEVAGTEDADGDGAGEIRAGTEEAEEAGTEEAEEAGTEEAEEAGTEEAEEAGTEEAEASLDEILREQFEGADEEEAEEARTLRAALTAVEEEEPRPRGVNEFVCRSCFLVKHRRQLADPVRLLCRDCADPVEQRPA